MSSRIGVCRQVAPRRSCSSWHNVSRHAERFRVAGEHVLQQSQHGGMVGLAGETHIVKKQGFTQQGPWGVRSSHMEWITSHSRDHQLHQGSVL